MKYMDFFENIKEDYPSNWNLDTFKSLKSFSQRVQYCNQILTRLSSGSSRIVYKIDEEKVLKLAKNRKGIGQNGVERDRYAHQAYDDIVAKVFESDENNLWLEMELAKKLTPTRFKQLVGVSLEDLKNYLDAEYSINNGNRHGYDFHISRIKPENLHSVKNNEFIGRLLSLIADMDLHIGDFGIISTYGEVVKNGTPSVVVVDLGFSKTVASDYYGVN